MSLSAVSSTIVNKTGGEFRFNYVAPDNVRIEIRPQPPTPTAATVRFVTPTYVPKGAGGDGIVYFNENTKGTASYKLSMVRASDSAELSSIYITHNGVTTTDTGTAPLSVPISTTPGATGGGVTVGSGGAPVSIPIMADPGPPIETFSQPITAVNGDGDIVIIDSRPPSFKEPPSDPVDPRLFGKPTDVGVTGGGVTLGGGTGKEQAPITQTPITQPQSFPVSGIPESWKEKEKEKKVGVTVQPVQDLFKNPYIILGIIFLIILILKR